MMMMMFLPEQKSKKSKGGKDYRCKGKWVNDKVNGFGESWERLGKNFAMPFG